MKVTALAGGVGGAKLLIGLQEVLASDELTAVINTGDDAELYGVHVSPDVDIVTYWLAGLADPATGWGLAGDSFAVVDALGRLGADTWFRLGDRDFATCVWRTMRLRDGATLSAVTDEVRRRLCVPTRILPMSDDRVRTVLDCSDGRALEFQDYFVRQRTEPEVVAVRHAGIESATPAPGVIESITSAHVVVICPSNPILSVAPIVSVPGIKDALMAHPRVVAVSPIIGGRALKGPADRLLQSLGSEASATAVARLYAPLCDVFVIDSEDASQLGAVEGLGIAAVVADTVMTDATSSARLARALVAL